MSEDIRVRWGWLKFMYAYTVVGAGLFGLAMVLAPGWVTSAFKWPDQDPIMMGAYASVAVAFGLLAALGLGRPLRFVPVLLLQLCYKTVWFIGVLLPLLVSGQLPPHGLMFAGIFASYIIGDLIAIPFPYVFARQTDE